MMIKRYVFLLLPGIMLMAAAAKAQESFYRVYQFETPLQGHLGFNVWDTYVGNSNLSYGHFGKDVSRQGMLAQAFEAEFAVTDHFSLSAYTNFEAPDGSVMHYSEARVEGLYRFGERFDHFVNFALYGEYYIPDQHYSTSNEAELRLIMDKDIEDFRLVLNPTLSKYVNGDESKQLQPGISAGAYYRRLFFLQPGVEYYSNFYDHSAMLFPTVDLRFGPYITWNLGAGFGLNSNSDKFTIKSILQFDIPVIRPSRLLR
ncbi:MAG: hypothetical protein JST19_07690 [Bacteroidetes bacterium]|nr:hypothetical protein [Bacteroidota bacterium]